MTSLLIKRDGAKVARSSIIQIKSDAVSATGEVTGYGSVFGNLDGGDDIVMPGAFKSSLSRPGRRQVAFLWQHCEHEPIGIWDEIAEDNYGLKCRGRIIDTERGADALKLLRAGAQFGLSIGFKTLREELDQTVTTPNGWPLRRLVEVDLWEISMVTFPMNDLANVDSVKSAAAARDPIAVALAAVTLARVRAAL